MHVQVFTGEHPFATILVDAGVFAPVLDGQRPPRPACDPPIPDYLWEYIQACWSHEPGLRPSSYKAPEQLSPPWQKVVPGCVFRDGLCLSDRLSNGSLTSLRWLGREQDLYESVRIIERVSKGVQGRQADSIYSTLQRPSVYDYHLVHRTANYHLLSYISGR